VYSFHPIAFNFRATCPLEKKIGRGALHCSCPWPQQSWLRHGTSLSLCEYPGSMRDVVIPRRIGGGALSDTTIRPSVCPMAQLPYRHAGCLQLSHCRPTEVCGLRTRPRTDVDPPRVELPSAGGISSRRPRGDNLLRSISITEGRLLLFNMWNCSLQSPLPIPIASPPRAPHLHYRPIRPAPSVCSPS